MEDILILGGGVAGIATAYFAGLKEKKAVVVETRSRPGGLLDSFSIHGVRFELGPHYSYSAVPQIQTIFDGVPQVTIKPEGWCWYNGMWVRHPLHNNLSAMPVEQRVEFLIDLINRPQLDAKNYYDWLLSRYGRALTDKCFAAYSEKVWTIPARELDIGWVGERMQKPDLRTVLLGALSGDVPNTYYLTEARYPLDGGFLSFIRPLIEKCDIRCNRTATQINHRQRKVTFSDGEEMNYRVLVNTLPLPVCVAMIEDAPAHVVMAAKALSANRLDLISIGFSRKEMFQRLWFYIYDTDLWAARAHTPRLFSPNNVPRGCDSIQFEFYSSQQQPSYRPADALFQNTLDTLERLGIAARDSILFWQHTHVPYANVIHDIGMSARRDAVLSWLEHVGILSVGRFGRWSYDSVAETIGFAAGISEQF